MNPLNQCTCTMKWPHKVLLPHAALRVLYVVVKYWFHIVFEFRCKGNASLNKFPNKYSQNCFAKKRLFSAWPSVKTLFCKRIEEIQELLCFRNIVLKREEISKD